MSEKVLIISLDGATWDVMDLLIKDGLIPNIAKIIKKGAKGKLNSTIPPQTAPAWAGFLTGVNPGKNGVFNFYHVDKVKRNITLVNSQFIRSPTLWDILSQVGKRIISINVPMTYPPKGVNGIIVGGILSPGVNSHFVYPQSLYLELKKNFPSYTIVDDRRPNDFKSLEGYVKAQISVEYNRFKFAEYLMKKYKWDVFMVHNQSLDTIQHSCWHYIFSIGREKNEVLNFYKEIDSFIGKLVSVAGKKTNVIIMSDHGFGPMKGRIHLNYWMKKAGYLRLKGGYPYLFSILEEYIKAHPKIKYCIGTMLNKVFSKKSTKKDIFLRSYITQNLIDWEKTNAFLVGGWPYGNIYINANGKKRKSLLKRLEVDLKKLKNPENTTESLISNIYKREEVYHGPYVEYGPDIIVEPNAEFAFFSSVGLSIIKKGMDDYTGTHRREGILIMNGPQVAKSNEIVQAEIVDLLPTILGLLGVKIPHDTDGRILQEVLKSNIVVSKKKYNSALSSGSNNNNDDVDEIKMRLKKLGYY